MSDRNKFDWKMKESISCPSRGRMGREEIQVDEEEWRKEVNEKRTKKTRRTTITRIRRGRKTRDDEQERE